MAKTFKCEREGFVLRGSSDEELLAKVEGHLAGAHPELVGKQSREELLAEIRAKAKAE
jgi:predicted small metal-binding protein